jgi:exoribonuclease-2
MAGSESGRIAFVRNRTGVAAGAILERNSPRVIVLAETAARETWSEEKVFWVAETRVPMHAARVAADLVVAFRERVEEALPEVDLPALWEVVAGDGARYSVADLADLAFSTPDAVRRAAVAWVLSGDDTYFRNHDGQYAPHSREAVESGLKRRSREDQEKERLDRVVRRLQAALDGTDPFDETDAAARQGASWLKALAVSESGEDKDSKRGVELLAAMTGGTGGEAPGRSFDMLVRLGVFHEDEVLGIHRHRLKLDFLPEVLADAERIATSPLPDSESHNRKVLRTDPGTPGPIAIDDPWTTDVDDALWLETAGGETRVHVLIADPSAAVTLEGPVGREGASRATSLYLPTGKVPMLPPLLSEGTLSLDGGADRPMLDFVCSLSADGLVTGFQVSPVFASLSRRMTYDEVDAVLADDSRVDEASDALQTLRALAVALRRRRVDAGAVIVDRDDVSIKVIDGVPTLKRQAADSPARRLVQEFMVLACSQAGRFARENGIPLVYRKQSPPEDKAPGAGLVPGSKAWAYKMLRSLKRAELSTTPEYHYGLGVMGYSQVTSPLRRFQDFLAHVQLKGFLREGHAPLTTERILRAFGDLETMADALLTTEREAKRYWMLKWLAQSIGAEVGGEVVAVQGSRALVELDETSLILPVPGMGHVAPGSRVRARVREVDPRRDRVTLGPV